MAEVVLHFELSDKRELEQTAQLIQERLNNLKIEAEAVPEETRLTGVEVAAAIGVGIVIVRSGRELVEELRKLIPVLRGFFSEIRGLKDVTVEVGNERVPIAQLTEQHLQKLAKQDK